MNKVIALSVSDLKITLRRGEALVLNLIVPIIVLIALSQTNNGIEAAMGFSYLQAVLATAMVSLGITTGFDRRFRVLVRLGTTPLGKRGLILSKILTTLITQLFQLFVLTAIGIALGFEPTYKWIFAVLACWIASCGFAGISLLVAGNLRAEANLGIQNLLYVFMMGIGALGLSGNIPQELKNIVDLTLPGALHSLLRFCTDLQEFSAIAFVSLLAHAVLLPILAAKRFSFDER